MTTRLNGCCSLLIAVGLSLTTGAPLMAEDGVTAKSVVVGQCAALSGPASGLGTGMNLGLKACIERVNAQGGIHGRTITLVTADDAYDPDKCIDGTVKLIEADKVFCLAGYVGTPTGKAALPIVIEKKVPLVGLFTGAMLFRQPVNRYVFNVRASYDDETEVLVERLTKDLGVTKVAVFYQNDSFGQAGLAGTEKALTKRGMTVIAKGTFERNTTAVKAGLATIVAAAPDAVVMVGPYKPIATFVKEARAAALTVPLATISFVGTENLIKEGGAESEGLIISQVVPSPEDTTLPLVKEYHQALAKVAPEAKPAYVSFEGYVTGKVLALGLEKAGAEPSREKLVDALDSMTNVDLGGMSASFAKDRHQASSLVFLTRVTDGKAKPVAALAR